ncbi:hypothetical protein ACLOJK_033058 [Asimina triloba]
MAEGDGWDGMAAGSQSSRSTQDGEAASIELPPSLPPSSSPSFEAPAARSPACVRHPPPAARLPQAPAVADARSSGSSPSSRFSVSLIPHLVSASPSSLPHVSPILSPSSLPHLSPILDPSISVPLSLSLIVPGSSPSSLRSPISPSSPPLS